MSADFAVCPLRRDAGLCPPAWCGPLAPCVWTAQPSAQRLCRPAILHPSGISGCSGCMGRIPIPSGRRARNWLRGPDVGTRRFRPHDAPQAGCLRPAWRAAGRTECAGCLVYPNSKLSNERFFRSLFRPNNYANPACDLLPLRPARGRLIRPAVLPCRPCRRAAQAVLFVTNGKLNPRKPCLGRNPARPDPARAGKHRLRRRRVQGCAADNRP